VVRATWIYNLQKQDHTLSLLQLASFCSS